MPVLSAGPPGVIELTMPEGTFSGRSLGHDDAVCWLMQMDGMIRRIDRNRITSLGRGTGTFRPMSTIDMRDRLQREYSRRLEVAVNGPFVVAAPRGAASEIASLLSEVQTSFSGYFSRRNFPLEKTAFPLVVIVFPNRQEFEEYARAEKTPVSSTLRGYYHRLTNRVATYLDENAATGGRSNVSGSAVSVERPLRPSGRQGGLSLRDTLVHEATHQLAFNMGLHPRLGETPTWVVEGLAMLFEEDSRRDDASSRNPNDRVNRSRLMQFTSYRQERRPKTALREFVSGEAVFRTSALDAYSESWALSFYLIETRSWEYSKYLRTLAGRDPLRPYPEEERRADFEAAFGKDWNWLEGQYLMWMAKLR